MLNIIHKTDSCEHYCIILHGKKTVFAENYFKCLSNKSFLLAPSKWYYFNPLLWMKCINLIKKINPDILHAHLFFSFVLCSIIRLFKFVDTVTVVSIYNLKFQTPFYEYYGYRLLSGCQDYFVTGTPVSTNEMIDINIPLKKIKEIRSIVYNEKNIKKGINIREKYKLGNTFIITRVSRFHKDKGYRELVNIISLLKYDYSLDFKAMFVGGGTEKDKIRKYAEKCGVDERIIFCGWQMNYLDYIVCSDIVVSTSIKESFGLANAAALKYGIPFVCFNAGHLDTLRAEGYKYSITGYSEKLFAEAVFSICSNVNERDKISKFLKSFYKKYFDEEKFKEFGQLYELV